MENLYPDQLVSLSSDAEYGSFLFKSFTRVLIYFIFEMKYLYKKLSSCMDL